MQKYTGVVIDAKGSPMTGVTVTVNVAGGSAATIYSDNGVTTKANPFSNDANGSFEFYAANGRYDIVLAKTGVTFVASDTTDIALFDAGPAAKNILTFPHTKDSAFAGAGATTYLGGAGAAGEFSQGLRVPFACTVRNLYCSSWNGPGASQTHTFTLQKNEVDTTVTAQTTGTGSPAQAQDTTNSASFAAGDRIRVKVVASGGAATSWINAAVEIDP